MMTRVLGPGWSVTAAVQFVVPDANTPFTVTVAIPAVSDAVPMTVMLGAETTRSLAGDDTVSVGMERDWILAMYIRSLGRGDMPAVGSIFVTQPTSPDGKRKKLSRG